jgi:hypothetical protein
VTFIDDHSATFLEPVGVWRTLSKTHQDDTFFAPQPKIHPSLKIDAEISAHLQIGNDITLNYHEWIARFMFRGRAYNRSKVGFGWKLMAES